MGTTAGRLDGRFWRIWTAVGVSSLGDGMVLVGLPLLALDQTHNVALIGGVAVASRLPAPFVALPAGALADRLDPRRYLAGLELSRFTLLLCFALAVASGHGGLEAIYAVAFLLGALTVAFDCVSSASVPLVVAREELVLANSRLSAVDLTGEEMVGRAVGGFAFAVARVVPFFVDAASFLFSAALLPGAFARRAGRSPGGVNRTRTEPAGSRPPLLDDVRTGVRWFARNPLLRLMSCLIAQLAFFQAMVLAILVVYATGDLHLSKAGYGLLLGVSAVGNLVGALAASAVHRRVGSGWCIVGGALLAAGCYPVLAATHSPFAAAGALTLESLSIAVGTVAAQSLRQATVPPDLQGRVGSAHVTLILAALPLGGLAGGLLGAELGVRPTILLAGCLQLTVVLISAPRLLARVRRQEGRARPPRGAHFAPPPAPAVVDLTVGGEDSRDLAGMPPLPELPLPQLPELSDRRT